MAYKVKTEIFEGPLDLLLHLIRKNEVDIYDIPIALITEQYMEYLNLLKTLDLNVAGEFILMASTLVHIKSKTLLPVHEETSEEEDDYYDPRDELVEKLLEYQRYKEAAIELDSRLILGRDVFSRGHPFALEGDMEQSYEPLVDISIFDLVQALQEILDKLPKDYTVDFSTDQFKIIDKINLIMETLEEKRSINFTALFPTGGSRGEIIVTFLAMLELCKMQLLRAHQTQDGVIRLYTAQDNKDKTGIPGLIQGKGNDQSNGN